MVATATAIAIVAAARVPNRQDPRSEETLRKETVNLVKRIIAGNSEKNAAMSLAVLAMTIIDAGIAGSGQLMRARKQPALVPQATPMLLMSRASRANVQAI